MNTDQTSRPATADTGRRKLTVFSTVMAAIGAALLLLAARIGLPDYGTMLGVLLVIGLAAALLGGLIGFLFGVPKFNKNFDPNTGYAQQHQYNPNTNLEDISDWLSKIIIGVTLTQLLKIPAALVSVANYVMANSATANKAVYAQPVIISVIIYFLITGFFISYCYTRVILPDLFRLTVRNNELEGENSILAEGARQQQAVVKSVLSGQAGAEMKSMNAPTPGQMLIASLTDDEKSWLQSIKSEGNKYTITTPLTMNQSMSLNVLIKKGIVSLVRGENAVIGSVISITDNDVLNAL